MRQLWWKTKLQWGADALDALQGLHAERALLVTDPFFAQNGTAQKIAQRLGTTQVTIFSEIQPDPSIALAAKGLALISQVQPQLLLALGGGSAIDCAKAMAFFYQSPVTFVAIPTTSGTGSEVTSFSILTHEGIKYPLVDAAMVPDMAILDDSLLQALPPQLIADAGMDVVAHCLEALVAQNATPISDALAVEAFSVVMELLPASFHGDTSVRGKIHLAATMAGMAFEQAGLGVCHAISHALGGVFHKAHGRLNAVLMPAVMSFNAASEGYRKAALTCGAASATQLLTVRSLAAELMRLRRDLKMPATLQELGISAQALQEQMDKLTQAAVDDPCCRTNPRPVNRQDVRQILESVL